MENEITVDEVFGITRDLPLNYIEREGVDDDFLASIKRKKHIVIYGSSKQGKTSLRKKHLKEDDYILVSCQTKWDSTILHSSILKQAGFKVEVSTEKSISGKQKIGVEIGGGINLALLKGKSDAKYEYEKNNEEVLKKVNMSLDPLDVNDLIKALNSIEFKKFIIIEDFHYLPQETQEEFSFTLKSFHENSDYVFIIIGVWREENRLIRYNGDLLERVHSINADRWTKPQLLKVIGAGENILNVTFKDKFKDAAIENSMETVHIVQEVCRAGCLNDQIQHYSNDVKELSSNEQDAINMVRKIVQSQSGRYQGALTNICEGFQDTDLKIQLWIIYALLNFEISDIENGISLRKLSRIMKEKHPTGRQLNNGSITQTLKALGSLQNKKGIRPLIFDYDTYNRVLSVVDNGFVIWLKFQKIEQIFEELDLPLKLTPKEMEKALAS